MLPEVEKQDARRLNLVPIGEMTPFIFRKSTNLDRAAYSARQESELKDGIFLVRNTRAGVPPDQLIHTTGNIDLCGSWFIGRVRRGIVGETFEVLIHRPGGDMPRVFQIYCPTLAILKKVLGDLELRGSQSFFSPMVCTWRETLDPEFRIRRFPK